jgi:hypothetical protein
MAQHRFWLPKTLNVWARYFAIIIVAIPAAAAALFLIARGMSEPFALFISVSLTLLFALIVPRLAFRQRTEEMPSNEFRVRYTIKFVSGPGPEYEVAFTLNTLPQSTEDEWPSILNEPLLEPPTIILGHSIPVAEGRSVFFAS